MKGCAEKISSLIYMGYQVIVIRTRGEGPVWVSRESKNQSGIFLNGHRSAAHPHEILKKKKTNQSSIFLSLEVADGFFQYRFDHCRKIR